MAPRALILGTIPAVASRNDTESARFQVRSDLTGAKTPKKFEAFLTYCAKMTHAFLRTRERRHRVFFRKGLVSPLRPQPRRMIMAPAMTSRIAVSLSTVSRSPKKMTAMIMPKMTEVSRRAATRAMGAMVMAQMAMP